MSKDKKIHKLTPAISIYQKHEDSQNTIEELSRVDMHFRTKDASDIVIEETGIHITNPFKFKIDDIVLWSESQNENVVTVMQNYSEYYNDLKTRLDSETTATYKPYLTADGFDNKNQNMTPDETIDMLRARIKHLRQFDDSFDAMMEVDHRVKNLFDYLYTLNGKNLENPLIKTYLDYLTYTNKCTVLQSVKEEEPKADGSYHNAYAHKQRLYSIGEIIEMTADPSINMRDKKNRPLVFAHSTGRRLIGDQLYAHWNGLQIFDIDLKFARTYREDPSMNAAEHRDILFNKLKHYPWLLGVTLSSSGRALHVYTKVSRMHTLTDNDEFNASIGKYWYRMSYVQKHAAIAYILEKYCGIEDIYDGYQYVDEKGKRHKSDIIDSSLARIGQGIAINHDPGAKWSSGFVDMYPCMLYHVPPEKGVALEDWLLTDKILSKYTSWFYENAQLDVDNDDIKMKYSDINIIVDHEMDVHGVKALDIDAMSSGEKYSIRWRVCNTIMYAFGDTDTARDLCHHILQTTTSGSIREVNAFIRSAIYNKKPADMSTLKMLKKLGVKMVLDEESTEALSDDVIDTVAYALENTDYKFYANNPDYNIRLDEGEYIGMKMNEILSAAKPFKVTVLESPPNTGKTEFIKSAAKQMTVCLVLPFTSVITSKIVNDESIVELFDLYYGDRSVSEIKKGRSAVMTIDKFASLPKSKYEMFDLIAIDESHLLYTSIYRLPVVSQTIENIRTYLLEDTAQKQKALNEIWSVQNIMNFIEVPEPVATSGTRFMLMTGTITGEVDYFKFYGLLNYVKVHKKHPFNKNLTVNLSRTSETRDILLVKAIARRLENGGKVIHPTNRGDAYVAQIMRAVEYITKRQVKYDYYKRANNDERFMENINALTTVDDIEILFCSDFLSVGIDIKDKGEFEIMYSNDFTAESIEQFNNRLRSTDINCQLFFDVSDSMGMQKPNIINTSVVRYEHTEEMRRMIVDEKNIAMMRKTINERDQYFAILGEMFSRYFVEDFTGNIKYVRSAFEIEQFEKQFTVIAKSLLYIKTALCQRYRYSLKVIKHREFSDDKKEHYDVLMRDAKDAHDIAKSQSFIRCVEFLSKPEIYNVLHLQKTLFVKDTDEEVNENTTDLYFGFDLEQMGGAYTITWHRQHKYSIENARKFVMKMRRLYSEESTNAILQQHVKPSGLIRKTEVGRYINLMYMIYDDKKNALSYSTKTLLETVYDHINIDMFTNDSLYLDENEYIDLRLAIRKVAEDAFKEMTDSELFSQKRLESIDTLASAFIDTLFHKKQSKGGLNVKIRRIAPFDSEKVQATIFRDQIYRNILCNDDTEIDYMETEFVSTEHVGEAVVEPARGSF